jgi:DHA1 family bicyclomycin/chloramphenicol resistance-like MFS transporter
VDTSPQPPPLGRHAFLLLIVVLGGVCTIGPFSTDLYLPALPSIAAELQAGSRSIQLTVTVFLAGLGIGQLFAGPLSDTFGRRRPLLAGLAIYTVASLLCAVAPSAGFLIAARSLQGLAGAAGVAISMAVVTDHFRGSRAAHFLSRLALISGMAPIVAPIVGAQLLRVTSWRGVYYLLTGIGVVLVIGVALGLRESLPAGRRTARGLAVAARTMSRLSRDGRFMGFTITSALTYAVFFAYLSTSSFVLQDIYGASPTVFSLLFAVNAVGMLLAAQLNGFLLARFSPRSLLGASLASLLAAGVALVAVTTIGGLGIVTVAVPFFVLAASMGVATPNVTALALSLHPDVAGSASAYFGTLRLALGAAATPLATIGGAVSDVPMALLMAAAAGGALAVFAATSRRPAPIPEPVLSTAEAEGELPVA